MNRLPVKTDQNLWSANYDRELVNVFAVQSAIAQEIAGMLRRKISPEEKARLDVVPTVVLEAYDNYLKARNILNASRYDYQKLEEAVKTVQRTSAT